MSRIYQHIRSRLVRRWRMFWLHRSGPRGLGRMAAWFASRHAAPYHQKSYLAGLVPQGFIAPSARLLHPGLRRGINVYVGDGVVVFRSDKGGTVEFQDRVHIYGDAFIETGMDGRIIIGEGTHIQPGCHMHAYLSEIRIGRQVEIAPCCAFYNYDHGMASGRPIMDQPLQSKGGISVGDGAWIGHGATILQGVTIGEGAVIAAGAVVTHDVPNHAIAAGVPAHVVRYRTDTILEPLELFTAGAQSSGNRGHLATAVMPGTRN